MKPLLLFWNKQETQNPNTDFFSSCHFLFLLDSRLLARVALCFLFPLHSQTCTCCSYREGKKHSGSSVWPPLSVVSVRNCSSVSAQIGNRLWHTTITISLGKQQKGSDKPPAFTKQGYINKCKKFDQKKCFFPSIQWMDTGVNLTTQCLMNLKLHPHHHDSWVICPLHPVLKKYRQQVTKFLMQV